MEKHLLKQKMEFKKNELMGTGPAPKKVGLVLGGGGGKGAFQAGVLKAFDELGLMSNISVISGTSVGALNGALATQNVPYNHEKLWLHEIKQSDILHIDRKKVLEHAVKATLLAMDAMVPVGRIGRLARHAKLLRVLGKIYEKGMFSQAGLTRILNKYFIWDESRRSDKKLFVCCSDVSKHVGAGKPVAAAFDFLFDKNSCPPECLLVNDYGQDEAVQALLATSALPFVFDPVEIKGRAYVDGGLRYRDNLPLKPAIDEGCDVIFVVPCFAGQPTKISEHVGPEFIQIIPHIDLEKESLAEVVNFSPSVLSRRFDHGYERAKQVLQVFLARAVFTEFMSQRREKMRSYFNRALKQIEKAEMSGDMQEIERCLQSIGETIGIEALSGAEFDRHLADKNHILEI